MQVEEASDDDADVGSEGPEHDAAAKEPQPEL